MSQSESIYDVRFVLAADIGAPLLQEISLDCEEWGRGRATLREGKGQKGMKSFCIALLLAKFRWNSNPSGSEWLQIAENAPKGTWAATLVEAFYGRKCPDWWTTLRENMREDMLSNVPRNEREELRKRLLGLDTSDPSPFVMLPHEKKTTGTQRTKTYEIRWNSASSFWDISRIALFLGDEKLQGDRLLQVAENVKATERDWVNRQLFTARPSAKPVQPTVETSVQPALDVQLDLLVWDASLHDYVSIKKPGRLPLHKGDRIQIQVNLNRQANVCMVWLTSQGTEEPLYPWEDGEWRNLSYAEVTTLRLPTKGKALGRDYLELDENAGTETVVLLADAKLENGLSSTELEELFRGLGRKFHLKRRDLCYPWDNDIRVRGIKRAWKEIDTAISLEEALVNLHNDLRRRLNRFALVKALSVANVGQHAESRTI